jgi:hypothetical protein
LISALACLAPNWPSRLIFISRPGLNSLAERIVRAQPEFPFIPIFSCVTELSSVGSCFALHPGTRSEDFRSSLVQCSRRSGSCRVPRCSGLSKASLTLVFTPLLGAESFCSSCLVGVAQVPALAVHQVVLCDLCGFSCRCSRSCS